MSPDFMPELLEGRHRTLEVHRPSSLLMSHCLRIVNADRGLFLREDVDKDHMLDGNHDSINAGYFSRQYLRLPYGLGIAQNFEDPLRRGYINCHMPSIPRHHQVSGRSSRQKVSWRSTTASYRRPNSLFSLFFAFSVPIGRKRSAASRYIRLPYEPWGQCEIERRQEEESQCFWKKLLC